MAGIKIDIADSCRQMICCASHGNVSDPQCREGAAQGVSDRWLILANP